MKIKIVLLSVLLGISGVSQAELFDRGGGMIYDDVLDITWLQDANMGGSMNWGDSVAWADGLSFGGFDDWRLASMDVDGNHMPVGNFDNGIVECNTATEIECRDNELGYMYYHNLISFVDQGLFTNISTAHWSGTTVASATGLAFRLRLDNGLTTISNKNTTIIGAWAVRAGDVIPDIDSDGVTDAMDNCTLVANSDQRDTNGDGYGNICDPDLNNDGVVNFADIGLWGPFFNTATTGDADFNGDGFANFGDYSLYPSYFLQPPGPSGVAP